MFSAKVAHETGAWSVRSVRSIRITNLETTIFYNSRLIFKKLFCYIINLLIAFILKNSFYFSIYI
jgi:hypothetical protein